MTLGVIAESKAFIDYTAKLTFTSISGFSSNALKTPNVALLTVRPGTSEIMRFNRLETKTSPELLFQRQYFPGKFFSKMPATTFEYLLPAAAGNHVQVTTVSSTITPMLKQFNTDYRATAFVLKLNDNICASRAGTILECIDTIKTGEKSEIIYRKDRNKILVLHRDGTTGIYAVTAPIKLLVKPGDVVFPGQPLAVLNKASEKYKLYFSVCYLDEGKLVSAKSYDNRAYYSYMSTVFYGSDKDRSSQLQINKEYTVQHPKNIIAAEMTKDEKKKFGY